MAIRPLKHSGEAIRLNCLQATFAIRRDKNPAIIGFI
jgi:hypothetical protein